jgi:hypothetical protein
MRRKEGRKERRIQTTRYQRQQRGGEKGRKIKEERTKERKRRKKRGEDRVPGCQKNEGTRTRTHPSRTFIIAIKVPIGIHDSTGVQLSQ